MQFLLEFVQISYFAISRSYIRGSFEINCINLSNDAKYFVVFSKEELKTGNCLPTFVAAGVVNTEIFLSFTNFIFTKKQINNVNNLTFCILGTFSGCSYRSTGMKFALDMALISPEIIKKSKFSEIPQVCCCMLLHQKLQEPDN